MSDGDGKTAGKLTTGPVGKHLANMTVPMIWGILAIIVVNLTDTFFVGQLGTEYLAAMGFVFPVSMIMFSLGIGLSAGATSVISRAIGGSTRDEVRRLTTDALTLSFLASSIFALLGIATIDPVFRLLGAEDDILPLIRSYMMPWYIGIVFLIVPMTGNGAIRACGDAKWPGLIMIGSAAINAVLDPLLIFGLWGFPRMEIAGAAWATLIARAFTLFGALTILFFRERLLCNPWPGMARYAVSLRRILHVAGPASLNQMLNPLAAAAITAMVATFGTGAVAAFGVAARIEGFALVVLYALSSAIGPLAGQNWGAGLTERAREALALCYRFCVIFGFGGAAVFFVAIPFITPWFDPDPAISSIADTYLRIVAWSYAFHGAVMMASAFFNGVGKPGPSLSLTVFRMAVLMVPLAWVAGQWFGLEGIFVAMALANTGAGILSIIWTFRVCRKHVQHTSPV